MLLDETLQALSAQLPDGIVAQAPDGYREEGRGIYHSPPMPLLRPRSTQEVSECVKVCSGLGLSIVPFAGGTGLVGGQTPTEDGLVFLSVERMNKLRSVHPDENVMVVEAGMILADVQAQAAKVDRLFPLSLASEGTARIGGNLATNAGGVQVLRYGNARDLCLGIEAVLADGSIYHGLKRLRKDNTGYDLRNLLVGSEGTLAIITAAALKLFPVPQEQATAMVAVPSPTAAIALLAEMQSALDGLVSGFELIGNQAYGFLAEALPQTRVPFNPAPAWTVLLEAAGGHGSTIQTRLETVLEAAFENETALDAVIAQSAAQRDEFWTMRESIPAANKKIGAVSSHDISLPISKIPEFVETTPALLAGIGAFRINCFGHLGDGNLHYNIFPAAGASKDDTAHLRGAVKEVIHDQVHRFDGSMSAEHGVGRMKVEDLEKYGDPAKLAMLRSIKQALDPNGVLNPGVIVRARD